MASSGCREHGAAPHPGPGAGPAPRGLKTTRGGWRMRLGFAGLGIMGQRMAANLLRGGHSVTVYNRTADRPGVRSLVEAGARVAATPAEVATGAEIVGLCVTDGAAVAELLHGPHGILGALRPGQLVADHSTIAPAQARALAKATAETGGEFLDAPVTGGDRGAAEGTLTIMVGGSAAGFTSLQPYLRCVGKTIVHVGASGQGQLVKLVNNFIGGIALAGAAEGLWLGLRGGVSLERMMEVLSAGSAQSVSLQLLAERLRTDNSRPGFSLRNRLKDMDLALASARELAAALPLGGAAAELFRERLACGEGDLDQTVLVRRYLAQAEGRGAS